MRWWLLSIAGVLFGQTFEVTPPVLKQGQVARVHTTGNATTARMNGRTVHLFPQAGGGTLGLMPVGATQEPGVYSLEFLAANGAVEKTVSVTVRDARFPRQNVVIAKSVAALKPSPGEVETAAAFKKTLSDTRYWEEPFILPVAGCMVSPYGVRRYLNGKATGDYHGGLDQRSPAGNPVHAIAAGVVRVVGSFNIHGGTVGIDHGQGVESMYLHLSKAAVTEGAKLKKGDVIGYSGSTGRSNAPHLHWTLYVNEIPVNPLQWVSVQSCYAPAARKRRSRHGS